MNSLWSVVFPSDCLLCGREIAEASRGLVCRECWATLGPWSGPSCARCGLPFASALASDSVPPLCAECRQEERPFDLARSYGLYVGPLRAVILQLKFGRRERLGKPLGELLAPVGESLGAREAVLVPVPLHASRKRERGFNQAELLAGGLARKLGKEGRRVRVEANILVRTRATAPQTGLSPAARQENVRGVFRVARPERVRGRAVCLVDDVMTTGATLSAGAMALKRAGAARVLALTLARATPQFPDLDSGASLNPVDEFGHNRT